MSWEHYADEAQAVLDAIRRHEREAIERTAQAFATTIRAEGLIYTFGTGHSSLLASEGLFRAGGLAPVCPILEPTTTFEVGALASSHFERLSGYAEKVLDRYPLTARDLLVVFSNSGVNALPVEIAGLARDRGVTVVAVTSRAYGAQAPTTSAAGERLAEVADLVIDNHVPPGDAVVPFGVGDVRVGSVSTVAGAFIWNAVVAHCADLLAAAGEAVPVYISSNMPGAREHNAELIDRYRPRNRHL